MTHKHHELEFRVCLDFEALKNIDTAFHTAPYLLTYSMVQSPSWEANWFAASQEIPRISRNPNVFIQLLMNKI